MFSEEEVEKFMGRAREIQENFEKSIPDTGDVRITDDSDTVTEEGASKIRYENKISDLIFL